MFKIKVSLNFWLVKNNKIFVTNFPVKMARGTQNNCRNKTSRVLESSVIGTIINVL